MPLPADLPGSLRTLLVGKLIGQGGCNVKGIRFRTGAWVEVDADANVARCTEGPSARPGCAEAAAAMVRQQIAEFLALERPSPTEDPSLTDPGPDRSTVDAAGAGRSENYSRAATGCVVEMPFPAGFPPTGAAELIGSAACHVRVRELSVAIGGEISRSIWLVFFFNT